MPLATDQKKKLFIVQVVCLVILWVFVVPLRIWSRILTKRGRSWKELPWVEDALMLQALLLYTLMAGFALQGIIDGGIGKHASEMGAHEAYVAFRAWFICELIYGPLSALVRTSIAVLILRFSPSKTQKWILYACLGIVYTFTIVYFFINLLQCSPPSYFWMQFENFNMEGSCGNPHLLPNAAIAHSVIAAVSDLTISVLSACTIKKNLMGSPTITTSDEKPQQNKMRTKLTELRRNKTKMVIMLFLVLGGAAGGVMLVRIRYIRILEITPDFLYRTVSLPIFHRRPRKAATLRCTQVNYLPSATEIMVKSDVEVDIRSATPYDDLGTRARINEKLLDDTSPEEKRPVCRTWETTQTDLCGEVQWSQIHR
ncbi:hypothetical protein X797_011214 [Metarhizium robertsii]|uniref:Rhodopsin domain-containing protein n=1 Tax=Metarhizium robertsii TaxID=568076 RepID=A0A0A1UMW2_9HYPO|nr:hypothetical protein X797_011214 [Metarhizium robertsii]